MASRKKTAPPTAEEVAAKLKGEWTDEQIERAYAAEAAAQRSVVDVPKEWPAALTDALVRRVQAFLDAGSTSRVGRDAPKVRELEKQYDRVPGAVPDPTE